MPYKLISTLLVALVLSVFSNAAAQGACESNSDGDWSDNAIWNSVFGATCPPNDAGATANIGHNITLDINVILQGLVLNSGTLKDGANTLNVDTLTIQPGFTLEDITITAETVDLNALADETLTITGDVTIDGITSLTAAGADCDNPVTINGSTLTLTGAGFPADPFIEGTATIAGDGASLACTPPPSSVGGFAEPLAPEGE